MFIIYSSFQEVIVCTPETEQKTVELYFYEGDRDCEEYNRETSNDEAVVITPQLNTH